MFRPTGRLTGVPADRYAPSGVPIYLLPPPPPPPPQSHSLAPPPPPPREPAAACPAPHYYSVSSPTSYEVYMQQRRHSDDPYSRLQNQMTAYNPRRPPPTAVVNGATKRTGDPLHRAGPTKRAKGDCHGLCEDCIRRQKRIEAYTRDIDRMQTMEADKRYLIKQKEQQIETQKQLFLSMVSPEKRTLLEFFIEGMPIPGRDSNSMSNTSSIPTTVVFQLLKFLLNNAPNPDTSINQHPATPRQPASRLDGADTPRATTHQPTNQQPFMSHTITSQPRSVTYQSNMPTYAAYYGDVTRSAHYCHVGSTGTNQEHSTMAGYNNASTGRSAAPQYPSYYTPF